MEVVGLVHMIIWRGEQVYFLGVAGKENREIFSAEMQVPVFQTV